MHYVSTNDVKAMEFYGSILKPWNVSRLGTRLACRIKLLIQRPKRHTCGLRVWLLSQPLRWDNIPIEDKIPAPNVSVTQRFHHRGNHNTGIMGCIFNFVSPTSPLEIMSRNVITIKSVELRGHYVIIMKTKLDLHPSLFFLTEHNKRLSVC